MSDCVHTACETLAHVDFCHAFAWVYRCEACGEEITKLQERSRSDCATRSRHTEREPCEGCRQVMRGDKPTDLDELREGVDALMEVRRLRLAPLADPASGEQS